MPSLNKYSGTWSNHQAAHLLRRSTFGATLEKIKEFGSKTIDECINILFQPMMMPDPPLNNSFANDVNVPIGETWIEKPVTTNVTGYRNESLRTWSMDLMEDQDTNIREKMTLFWNNHFVTASLNDPRHAYRYITLLRSNVIGNFKQLTKDIVVDPGMLTYLNGNQNSRQAPNENFARELMELFTLGKGDLAGPGDYTTFTETDVKEVAKSLTGWVIVNSDTIGFASSFNTNRHDNTTKKLSHRFNNVSIINANANEYKNLIDIIFQRDDVSLFISRKLYRWFLFSDITAEIETNIIVPLAKIIRDNDYEISQALKALLSSDHFYDECIIGSMIKNPIDFLMNPVNQFNVAFPTEVVLRQRAFKGLYDGANAMEMGLFQAPSVAGWSPYYQTPNFYRIWLNATSLPARKTFTDAFMGNGVVYGAFRLQANVLSVINKMATPSDVNNVLDEFILLLFCKPVAANQRSVLKTTILDGSSEAQWTTQYNTYNQNQTNVTAANVILVKARKLLVYMMRMPEYHVN